MEEKIGKMVVNRGNKHNFVGMDIELRDDGRVKIFMKEYIKESILAFGIIVEKGANTPAKHKLFTVGEPKLLDQMKAGNFHHIVVKLLYVCKSARLDIDLAVSFLCTRVHVAHMKIGTN